MKIVFQFTREFTGEITLVQETLIPLVDARHPDEEIVPIQQMIPMMTKTMEKLPMMSLKWRKICLRGLHLLRMAWHPRENF